VSHLSLKLSDVIELSGLNVATGADRFGHALAMRIIIFLCCAVPATWGF